jgi:hypothetical protein
MPGCQLLPEAVDEQQIEDHYVMNETQKDICRVTEWAHSVHHESRISW